MQDFDSILNRMQNVQSMVEQIDSNVDSVMVETQGSSDQLARVSERMTDLEKHFSEIDGLIESMIMVSPNGYCICRR